MAGWRAVAESGGIPAHRYKETSDGQQHYEVAQGDDHRLLHARVPAIHRLRKPKVKSTSRSGSGRPRLPRGNAAAHSHRKNSLFAGSRIHTSDLDAEWAADSRRTSSDEIQARPLDAIGSTSFIFIQLGAIYSTSYLR
jgi:hypothetical protein